jgi:hypothetical protein
MIGKFINIGKYLLTPERIHTKRFTLTATKYLLVTIIFGVAYFILESYAVKEQELRC